jgi:hypothetical protein
LTASDLDIHWMEPRWSPDGRHIAAATWRRGGVTSIVVLDTLGNRVREIAASRSVQGAPSWSPDGRWILFSSDRTGTPDVYAARVVSSMSPNARCEQRSTVRASCSTRSSAHTPTTGPAMPIGPVTERCSNGVMFVTVPYSAPAPSPQSSKKRPPTTGSNTTGEPARNRCGHHAPMRVTASHTRARGASIVTSFATSSRPSMVPST